MVKAMGLNPGYLLKSFLIYILPEIQMQLHKAFGTIVKIFKYHRDNMRVIFLLLRNVHVIVYLLWIIHLNFHKIFFPRLHEALTLYFFRIILWLLFGILTKICKTNYSISSTSTAPPSSEYAVPPQNLKTEDDKSFGNSGKTQTKKVSYVPQSKYPVLH